MTIPHSAPHVLYYCIGYVQWYLSVDKKRLYVFVFYLYRHDKSYKAVNSRGETERILSFIELGNR